jgi:hypothetical protein
MEEIRIKFRSEDPNGRDLLEELGVDGIIKKNSVVLLRKRTIPTEQPQPADEVSANFS